MVADAAAAGHDEEEAGDELDEAIEILPANADACRLFFAAGTQWRSLAVAVGPRAMIVRTSIDYGALGVVAAALKIDLDASLLAQVQVMEVEAAAAMAEAAP